MPETKKPKGGRQPGAGRKPLPEGQKLKQRSIYVTDAEWTEVQQLIQDLRQKKETGQ
jgi:hypothetical protein